MLNKILHRATERAVVAEQQIDISIAKAKGLPQGRSLSAALQTDGLAVVAEIKRRSPSVGDIDLNLDPASQAMAYVNGGADAISVLTEPSFFGGSMDDLAAVCDAVGVPVLRKDFTMSVAQIWEARAGGADAILLIVAALSDELLTQCIQVADEVGVEAIVEAHTSHEVQRALAAGARIVGVNNRNLKTFKTDLSVAESIASDVPDGIVSIAESGVSDVAGAHRMARAGYDAILVGEALVRSSDPGQLVADLKGSR